MQANNTTLDTQINAVTKTLGKTNRYNAFEVLAK